MLMTLLKFHHINYYCLIKYTRDTCGELSIYFSCPHVSLSDLHCVHCHNPMICALTGQEHTHFSLYSICYEMASSIATAENNACVMCQ